MKNRLSSGFTNSSQCILKLCFAKHEEILFHFYENGRDMEYGLKIDHMISKHTAVHYSWGDQCDGWRLIDHTNQSIIHENMPPGTREIRHYHNKATQFFFVLSGIMDIEADGVEQRLKQHEGIEIKAQTPHQVFNRSGGDLEFLVISHPGTQNDRVNL